MYRDWEILHILTHCANFKMKSTLFQEQVGEQIDMKEIVLLSNSKTEHFTQIHTLNIQITSYEFVFHLIFLCNTYQARVLYYICRMLKDKNIFHFSKTREVCFVLVNCTWRH